MSARDDGIVPRKVGVHAEAGEKVALGVDITPHVVWDFLTVLHERIID